jgi:hypothetical protein
MIGSIASQSFIRPDSANRDAAPQAGPEALTPEERAEVEDLKRRDQEVRAHEQAHATAGGSYADQPSLQFQRGPDGRSYAVSGEVKIDTSKVPGNRAATVRKMEAVKRAALAPSQPSAKDRQVAAEAERKAQEARQEAREAKEADDHPTAADPDAPTPDRASAEYRRTAEASAAEGGQAAQSINLVV